MNERDTFNNRTIDLPNYRIDNSNKTIAQSDEMNSVKPQNTENYPGTLSKTKIININDFIFRQYLEFYPELAGLSCKENVLYLKEIY